MNSVLHIKQISTSGDWSPLFSKLSGWVSQDGKYSDGHHIFSPGSEAHFELQANTRPLLENLKTLGNTSSFDDKVIAKSPGGIEIPIYYVEHKSVSASPYRLNHVALSVRNIDSEAAWWKGLFQCKEVLRVNQGFDPIVNGPFNTLHMYKEGELYVTLREQEPDGDIHHLGFELTEERFIDAARGILKEIGWSIFWEGMIDESYVLHFIGPDKRIHDFFYPNAHLKSLADK